MEILKALTFIYKKEEFFVLYLQTILNRYSFILLNEKTFFHIICFSHPAFRDALFFGHTFLWWGSKIRKIVILGTEGNLRHGGYQK
jgi:hypothetical protein